MNICPCKFDLLNDEDCYNNVIKYLFFRRVYTLKLITIFSVSKYKALLSLYI